ncbi:K(+)/H(+) antiporter NhaP [Pseudobythopirellula maris]|uniref:K(+)/H(+) antiporter NhaP n=1 Tax=Pseudobythopirellula maris TaxID=2527991 RepID=A0A5C5ZLR7_9BACT|nr:sodium:proton antiporter [Pseudobythopirellula maris]TWT88090.1 K(+)/H(+) antiporter NhaP [Pseudobythopirellula maris]
MENYTALYLAGVLALGIFAQWLAWRLKLPAIVLLLAFGFNLGVMFGPPEEYLGSQALLPIVSLAVGVILFEGGLSLRFHELRESGGVVLRLVTVGLLVTWAGATLAAYWIMGFTWPMATLLGALLTVSGPTVIMPLLRQVRPTGRVASLIKWEGIVNDPIGAVLAALVFEVVAHGVHNDVASESLVLLGRTALVGLGIGAVSAWLIVQMLRHYWLPDFLQIPVVLAMVVTVFAVSNYLQHESGLVTVTALGVLLANQRAVAVKHLIEFKENLRTLLISVLFILLSSRVQIGWDELGNIGWSGLLFVALLILVIRPIAAFISTVGSDLTFGERVLLGWIHPRGIVAAAVASLFAINLGGTELAADGDRLVIITFLVIVGTVTVYGLTLGPLAKHFGLAQQDPQGVLFASASPLVREMAKSLQAEGFAVMLVDTNPQHISAARMAGLPVCYASIGSEFVREEVEMGDIGRLVAMTPNDEINSLAATEFAEHFGSANVYQLAAPPTTERHERVPSHRRGRTLFREDATPTMLAERFARGQVIKKTTLSDDFTYEDFRSRYGQDALILFTVPEKGKLTISVAGRKLEQKPGKKIIALVDKEISTGESGVLD